MAFIDAEAQVQIGKSLSYCTTANGTFIEIFGTTTITPPEREIGKAEYTNDNSPNKTKQYKPSLTEPGTCSATYKFQPTQFEAIDEHFVAGTTLYWKLETVEGTVRAFQGFMTKHNEGELGLDEVPDIELEIQVSGAVTYTLAA